MREVSARIDGMAIFTGRRWFWLHMECIEFSKKNIPEGQFQRFIDISRYLQCVTGETLSTMDSQKDELHADKVRNTKE